MSGGMTVERQCACGCGVPLNGLRRDAIWASRAHAVRWARENPGRSLYAARSANRARTRRRSGLQVSYRKAVEAVAGYLGMVSPVTPGRAIEEAELVLRPALSPRQRELLEQRETA